jgi:hypothetical protein
MGIAHQIELKHAPLAVAYGNVEDTAMNWATDHPKHYIHSSPVDRHPPFHLTAAAPYGIGHGPGPPPNAEKSILEEQKAQAWKAQEALQDSREELLGLRFALRTKRKALTNLRRETGAAEGRVLDQIRQFLQKYGEEVPEQISIDYSSLNTLRDRLGFSEVQYDQDEQMYNDRELRYTQKEADFVEGMTNITSKSDDFRRTDYMPSEIDELTRFANGPDTTKMSLAKMARPPPRTTTSDPPVSGLAGNNISTVHSAGAEHVLRRAETSIMSLPDLSPALESYPNPGPSVCSDSALSQMPWLDARKRIDLWFWDSLQCSALQRAMLRQYVSRDDLDESDWWSLVEAHWVSGPCGVSQVDAHEEFHDRSNSTPRQSFGLMDTVEQPHSSKVLFDLERHSSSTVEQPQLIGGTDHDVSTIGPTTPRSSKADYTRSSYSEQDLQGQSNDKVPKGAAHLNYFKSDSTSPCGNPAVADQDQNLQSNINGSTEKSGVLEGHASGQQFDPESPHSMPSSDLSGISSTSPPISRIYERPKSDSYYFSSAAGPIRPISTYNTSGLE